MTEGWIKLHKQIRKHWLWECPEFLKAWIDMLMMANWKDRKKLYKMELHKIKKGEFPVSIRKLSLRWDWSTGKVQRFLNLLKTDKMIDTLTDTGYTLVKIVNYEQYQVVDRHTDRHTDDTLTDTTIRSNKILKERKEEYAREIYFQLFNKLKKRFGYNDDDPVIEAGHYTSVRHNLVGLVDRWPSRYDVLIDRFLSDKKSEISQIRYLCEQGIDKYANYDPSKPQEEDKIIYTYSCSKGHQKRTSQQKDLWATCTKCRERMTICT